MADPRLTPARPDLAAAHLKGEVTAARFAEPTHLRIVTPIAGMRAAPDQTAPLDTELLMGEQIAIYERTGEWAWGQAVSDGYVGYVPAHAVGEAGVPTHRVATLGANVYAAPRLKSPWMAHLPFGARLHVAESQDGFCRIGPERWVSAGQLADQPAPDWVAVAETFEGVPYQWGGRSSWGLDCSALVQLSCQAAGIECARDSDMQAAALGETLAPGTPPRRGDLMFWRGHVAIVIDTQTLLHATAHGMRVRREKISHALARIAAEEFGALTRHARLGPGGARG